MNQHSSHSSSSHTGHSVLSRAQSLRQSFAESRNSYSATSGCNTTGRWGHQSTVSTTTIGGLSSQKSPSPSRATAKNCIGSGGSGGNNNAKAKRPASVNWMTPTSPSLSPRANPSSSGSRPATPTTCSLLDYSSTDYSPTRFQSQLSQPQQRDEALTNTPAAGPTPWRLGTAETMINSKVHLDRRGILANFKSKSLDLLGSSSRNLPSLTSPFSGQQQQPQQQNYNNQQSQHQYHHQSMAQHRKQLFNDASSAADPVRQADRRRLLFRRKKASSASPGCSNDGSPAGSQQQSRSSSIESQSSSSGNAIQRGLESVLKASTLFAWSSVDASNCISQHLPANQPSFMELLEDQLKSGPELTRIEHLSDLHYPDADPPCHFCSKQSSLAIHDSNRLKIVSGGRVRGRDGSRDSINPPYINLPSPNFQEDEPEGSSLFPGGLRRNESDVSHRAAAAAAAEEEQSEPPASVLTRRRALVPPKIPPYNMDSTEDVEHTGVDKETSTSSFTENDTGCCGGTSGSIGSGSSSNGSGSRNHRRSSFVVIPPMQICPGDLLVYSKVLTQRNNILDWEGSTQSLAGDTDGGSSNARKQHKNSWSLLKLFDRSGRTKSESLSGLEEVLTCLQPSTFCDDQLSRFRGLCWNDFLAIVQQNRDPKNSNRATKSTLTSTTEEASSSSTVIPPNVGLSSPSSIMRSASNRAFKPQLVRQSTQQDYSSRIKEWTQEKRARLGLVRTMSERSLDRKMLIPTAQSDQSIPESPVLPTVADSTPLQLPPANEDGESGETEETVESFLVQPPPGLKSEQRRKEALWDLFQSECAFLYDHIMVLKNVYMDPLKKIQVEGYAMFAEPELLFGNLDELCCVTYTFCKEFISLLLQYAQPIGGGDTRTTHILTKLFQKSSKAQILSQAYHRYALNYINALNYLETMRRHMEFCEFEKWCNRDPRCKKLQLTDLLVAPVQHIMKVPLLLREIEARTEDLQEKEVVLKILDKEEASLRELDDKMKWLKNFERLLEIQRSLVWPSVLDMEPKIVVPEFLKNPLAKQPCERLIVSPRRQIVLEGPLNLLDTGRPSDMHVILFDDMLLITRKKKGLGKKKSSLGENWPTPCSRVVASEPSGNWRYIVYKQPLSLDRFFLHEINAHEAAAAKLENGFVIICLNRFQQIIGVHTFQASSEQVKHTWLLKIRETQDRWKRTLQTTVFRAQNTLSSSPSAVPFTSPSTATALNKELQKSEIPTRH